MPTKIVANVQTGEVIEMELEGDELEAYNRSLAEQADIAEQAASQVAQADIAEQAASQVAQDIPPSSGQNTFNS
jgi:hypothetical protein